MVDAEFINKYAPLVTDNVCIANNVDTNNKELRALLAYSLLTGEDYVEQVPLSKPMFYAIDRDLSFINMYTDKIIGVLEDLIRDPVKLAFDIALYGSESYTDTELFVSRSTITNRHFSWIADLFSSVKGAINYYNIDQDKLPMLWKLCSHEFTDINHVEPSTKVEQKVLYAFAKGDVFSDEIGKSWDAFINTKMFSEDTTGRHFSSEEILSAYISENNLNYTLVKPQKKKR